MPPSYRIVDDTTDINKANDMQIFWASPILNCWEYFDCGRDLNGNRIDKLGICPTAEEKGLNGAHDGKNGGRACWVVAGTFCKGIIQGTHAQKEGECLGCDFYKTVKKEESPVD